MGTQCLATLGQPRSILRHSLMLAVIPVLLHSLAILATTRTKRPRLNQEISRHHKPEPEFQSPRRSGCLVLLTLSPTARSRVAGPTTGMPAGRLTHQLHQTKP